MTPTEALAERQQQIESAKDMARYLMLERDSRNLGELLELVEQRTGASVAIVSRAISSMLSTGELRTEGHLVRGCF